MFQRLIDDVRVASGVAARQTFFVAAAAGSLFIATCFLCAAAFVFVMDRYGLPQACLTGAVIFFLVTLITAGSYLGLKRQAAKRVVKETKSAAQSFTPDPMMLAAGLQVARAIGFKKIVPIIAIAGLALGVMAARSGNSSDEDREDNDE